MPGQDREDIRGLGFRVRGLVQGVGFRPTVWRLARDCALDGDVRNDGEGVLIRAWGRRGPLEDFRRRLLQEAPTLARIDGIDCEELTYPPGKQGFEIRQSEKTDVRTAIVADAATCPDCLAEIFDPNDRRFRYPFTNCTHCGPRLSIVSAIPYDRDNTAMSAFPMCPSCQAEYGDPVNRRFHAQPNACPDCGPRAWLEDAEGKEVAPAGGLDAIGLAAELIREGAIVAIKGIGGFHVACDAGNETAVQSLRRRKHRDHKPFALMARDSDMVARHARLDEGATRILQSNAAPIVVLRRKSGQELASGLAPGHETLGFMVPYSPLHHLLMSDMERPIVLTSGNLSDEPQCLENGAAHRRLAGICDYWLLHDRKIVNRLDDSVVRADMGAPRVLRRARGFAPESLILSDGFDGSPKVLAMGADLKNTFCLLRNGEAILSPHIGDLEDSATHKDYRKVLALYRQLFQFEPALVAVDLHPDYHATQIGLAMAEESSVPLLFVQHHHAHVAACLAEHRYPLDAKPVLGIVLDGLGMGEGGELWGGEFLRADYRGAKRLGRLAPLALPGGNRATREPWRNSFAHIHGSFGFDSFRSAWPDLAITAFLAEKPVELLQQMIERGVNSPRISSAGRLFDAVAAVLGLHRAHVSYEGQAAIELEMLAAEAGCESAAYGFDVGLQDDLQTLSWDPLWRGLFDDLARGEARSTVARRFHNTLIDAVSSLAKGIAQAEDLESVILSGGVFQNAILLQGVTRRLGRAGLRVLTPLQVPANDGGIALGQAVVAAARDMS